MDEQELNFVSGAISIQCAGLELNLLPGRALFLPARRTLVTTDVHFGKDETFRSAGIPIPDGPTTANIERLEKLLVENEPARLIILGDFLHARRGRGPRLLEQLQTWRSRRPTLEIILVRGNHDHHAGDPPDDLRIQCVHEPFTEPPLAFCHWPCETKGLYSLCGHLHPGLCLADRTGASLRVSCFWFRERSAILPAFGSFTGRAPITPRPGERVFAVCDEEVIEVNPLQRHKRAAPRTTSKSAAG